MGGVVFPPCWLFSLKHPSTRACCWAGPGLSAKMSTSGTAHANDYSLGPLSPVSLPPQWATDDPSLPRRPPRPTGGSGPDSYGVSALSWVPVHVKPCVCPPRVESLFPQVLWSSCTQAPLSFKTKSSGGHSSQCQTPRLGSLMWGSEVSLLWENLCDIIIFQFVCHPPCVYGIWLYCESAPPTISLWLLHLCM